MAEQEKGRGRLNRTLCGGRRAGEARGRGVQPPRGLQGRRAQGRAPSSLHPPGRLVPCKRKPVPTSSALEASASFQENGFQFSRRWYVNGNDGDGLL